ncbi:MAG: ABC transporter permease, partial [Proteobacteria bacterium]|nr:ABC transporter permease [Pseudomonadota bacterium]
MPKLDKQFIKKVRRQDRFATRAITVGGLLVIASVIAILVLIVRVTLPLFQPAGAEISHRLTVKSGTAPVLAVGMDDTQEVGFTLDTTGLFSFYDLASGKPFFTVPASTRKATVQSVESNKNNVFALLWEDNSVTVSQVDFRLLYDDSGLRTVQPEISQLGDYPPRSYPAPVKSMMVRSHEGRLTQVALLADNRFQIDHEVATTNILGDEKKEAFSFLLNEELPGPITAFTLDEQGSALFAGTGAGSLLRWDLGENESAERTDNVVAVAGDKPVTALAMVFGDISVAVGGADGSLATWSQIWTGEGDDRVRRLRKTHTLTSHQAPVERIIPSRRSKSLVSLGADGKTHFDHMTSEKHLLNLDPALTMAGISGQGNGLIGLDSKNTLTVWNVDSPHPEISLKTLFGKVWYESYDKPEYVWQSSSASDDFEPKLSLVPLLFGTIKGTLYAMIFAVPLAIFGAVYTSQFSTAGFKKTVKPVVEIMASIPSVVIGFLIALWLAPIVEKAILAVILGVLLLPLIFVTIMAVLRPFYKTPTLQNFCSGHEFLLLVPVIFLAGALAMGIAPFVEQLLFAGDFKQWLYNDLGLRY